MLTGDADIAGFESGSDDDRTPTKKAAESSTVGLHLCVVTLLWPSGIIDFMMFTFENRVLLKINAFGGVIGVSSFLLLMNSFNKTKTAVFPMYTLLS